MITSQTGTETRQKCSLHSLPVFTMGDRPKGPQCLELEDHECENNELPVDPEHVQDLLLHLDLYKSMRSVGIHPRILKDLLVSLQNLS